MAINLYLPAYVRSDINGYTYFGNLLNSISDFENENINIDFSDCIWFEANLSAVLGSIISQLEFKGNKVKLINIREEQKSILCRNSFLGNYGHELQQDERGTTVSYNQFKITDEKLIKTYIGKELLDKKDMPVISPTLRTEIIRSIFEIYSNAITHGACDYVFSCGQYYPGKTPPYMYFTIVDIGKTIKQNVSQFVKNSSLPGNEAIEWAIKEGHTTKTGPHPGGLGLSLILEFITKNNGKIQIVSADGYWELNKGQISSSIIKNELSGTIVNLAFNLADTNAYYLKTEKSVPINF